MTEKPPENAASDLYRHPRVQGTGNRETASAGGFKKSYDLYSLGVVLLEIAYWKPLTKYLEFQICTKLGQAQRLKFVAVC